MKKIIIYSLLSIVICILFFTFFTFNKTVVKNDQLLVEAYENVGFKLIQSDINVWAELNNDLINKNHVKNITEEIAKNLGLKKPYEMNYQNEENNLQCIIKKASKYAMTEIKVEKISNGETKTDNYYAVINVVLYDNFQSTEYLKQKIEDIIIELKAKPVTNITMAGYYPGNISERIKKKTVSSIFSLIGAKKIDELRTKQIYNVYGYTKMINDYVKFAYEKVNVDLSIKYNEYEDKTYLYLATPVITIEY